MTMDDIVKLDHRAYQKLQSNEFNKKTDTIRFDKEIIYISYLSIVNGCADYSGDIEIKKDSIFLKLNNINGIECTEQRCDRLIFKIRNPNKEKYKVVKW